MKRKEDRDIMLSQDWRSCGKTSNQSLKERKNNVESKNQRPRLESNERECWKFLETGG